MAPVHPWQLVFLLAQLLYFWMLLGADSLEPAACFDGDTAEPGKRGQTLYERYIVGVYTACFRNLHSHKKL